MGRLGGSPLLGRVYVASPIFVLKRTHVRSQPSQPTHHAFLAMLDEFTDLKQRGSAVDGAKRLKPAFDQWYGGVELADLRSKLFYQLRAKARNIAGADEDEIGGGFERSQCSERSGELILIRYEAASR